MDTNSSISFVLSFPPNETANFSNRDIKLLSDIQLNNISSLLPQYKYLNLANNSIKTMDSNFISQFSNACYLNISNNKITKIQGIESLNNLKYLDVSNNEIAFIESIESCNETLERLYAFHNNIQSIFFTSPMNKLEIIDVRDNQISKLSFGQFVPHLHTLKIDNNKNLCDISELSNFNELEVFSASSNQISEIPRLSKFTLRTLNLSNNQIKSLSSLNLTKLVTLDVSANPIDDNGISGQLEVNKNLRYLFISSTGISRCYCLAKAYPNLSTVDLSKTKLDSLNDLLSFVHEMKNLKVLNVRDTPLTRNLYPEADLLSSANTFRNQSGFPQQEKRYDSISIYNQQYPENSEKRVRFRSEILKSAISQLQSLDLIKVTSDELPEIVNQTGKENASDEIIEEEEEMIDDNDGYNLDYNSEDEEDTINHKSDQIVSENSNEKPNLKENLDQNTQINYNNYNFQIENKILNSNFNNLQTNNINEANFDSDDDTSDKEIIQSFIDLSQKKNQSSEVSSISSDENGMSDDDYSPNKSSNNNNNYSSKHSNYNQNSNNNYSSKHSNYNQNSNNNYSSKHSNYNQNSNNNYYSSKTSNNNNYSSKNSNSKQSIDNGYKLSKSSNINNNIPDSNKNNSINYNPSKNSGNNQIKSINQFNMDTRPFANNVHLYNFLTKNDDNSIPVPENIDDSNNEEEDEEEEEEEEEDDEVMITTQIITQALNSSSERSNIDKNVEYINRTVQNEIDSICSEQQKRHKEKMKKIKKLRKENKMLEKEIEKYRLKKLAREAERRNKIQIQIEKKKSNKQEQINDSSSSEIKKSHSRRVEQIKAELNSIKKSSNSHHHHSHSISKTENKNKNSSVSHHHHNHSHSHSNSSSQVKATIKDSINSNRKLRPDKASKSSDKKSSISSSNSQLSASSEKPTQNSSSSSNSYVVKTSTKSISIQENNVIPKNNNNEDKLNSDDNNFNNVKKAFGSSKNSQKSSQDYPHVIELIDGLLAENDQLHGKISASIKQQYSSTPTSPNSKNSPNTNSTNVKPFTISSSSQKGIQKVSKNFELSDSNHNSTSKKSTNLFMSSQAHRKRSKTVQILSDEVNHMILPFVTREYAEQKLIQYLRSTHFTQIKEKSDELKFLLLWLVKGLPLSPKNIKLNLKDITMARNLSINSYNLTIKAIDKNKNYCQIIESNKKLKNLQLLMLFNLNGNSVNYDLLSTRNISESNLDLDIMFNFDFDQIPQDAEFFKNLNYFFKGMPPHFCVTVCAVDLGSTIMLMNAKSKPSKHKQEKIALRGFDSICYEKNGHQCYILFDKSRIVPIYTLLFSTI